MLCTMVQAMVHYIRWNTVLNKSISISPTLLLLLQFKSLPVFCLTIFTHYSQHDEFYIYNAIWLWNCSTSIFNLSANPHHLCSFHNVIYTGVNAAHALIPNFPYGSPKERSFLMLPFPESSPSHIKWTFLFKTQHLEREIFYLSKQT